MNYLSIDLDFFINDQDFYEVFSKPCFKQDCEIVMNHEELLPDISKFPNGCHNLYNLDYHADIIYFGSSEKVQERNYQKYLRTFMRHGNEHYAKCSSWVNCVCWQSNSNYYWIHPSNIGISGDCWTNDRENPFKHKSVWKSLHRDTNIDIIPWNNINRIGICVSPEWICEEFINLNLIKKQNRSNFNKLSKFL